MTPPDRIERSVIAALAARGLLPDAATAHGITIEICGARLANPEAAEALPVVSLGRARALVFVDPETRDALMASTERQAHE